jgi:hypothetical protein
MSCHFIMHQVAQQKWQEEEYSDQSPANCDFQEENIQCRIEISKICKICMVQNMQNMQNACGLKMQNMHIKFYLQIQHIFKKMC